MCPSQLLMYVVWLVWLDSQYKERLIAADAKYKQLEQQVSEHKRRSDVAQDQVAKKELELVQIRGRMTEYEQGNYIEPLS